MRDGIITGHWSATPNRRLNDYHIEAALTGSLDAEFHAALLAAKTAHDVDIEKLRSLFTIWKNNPLSYPTDYGTWELNHDPRDGQSPDVEIGMLCMYRATTTEWGAYPFTIAHAFMLAAIAARVAQLKGLDVGGSFETNVRPDVLQNGPIFIFSTHAERAIQTYNPPPNGASDETHAREFGYFLGSGDPNLRWDITVLDPSQIGMMTGDLRVVARNSAEWLRDRAHEFKAAGITDFWGLDR